MITYLRELFVHFIDKVQLHFVVNWQSLAVSIAIAFSVNLAIMIAEAIVHGWQGSSLHRLFGAKPSKSAINDIVLFFLVQSSLATILGSILTFGVISVFNREIRFALAPWQLSIALSPVLYYVAYLFFIDFFNYWNHRFFHRIGFLWEIHKLHHSATEMTVLTATRDHPVERIIGSVFVVLPVALLAPPTDIALLSVFVAAIGPIKHSGMDWGWSWFGKYVIQSPRAHRIHHSIDPIHYNTNYASIFSFWDHVFGTWCRDEESVPLIGIPENPMNVNGCIWDMAHCYHNAIAMALSALRPWNRK